MLTGTQNFIANTAIKPFDRQIVCAQQAVRKHG